MILTLKWSLGVWRMKIFMYPQQIYSLLFTLITYNELSYYKKQNL